LVAGTAFALSGAVLAQGNSIHEAAYEVTITNVTQGVYFTPIMVGSPHSSMV
jgi:hypothetical protein